MKFNILNKRIPTLLALLLITIGVGLTSFLVKNGTIFTGLAGPSNQPQDVRITNITGSSFTVSYTTESSVLGSLNFGKGDMLGSTAIDERDEQAKNVLPHKVHSITAANLSPQTTYLFSITSGANTYLNNSALYRVTTGVVLSNNPGGKNIAGKILLSDGTVPTEAIVYVTADGAQIISSLATTSGDYSIPLSSIRSSDVASYFEFSELSNIKMLITNGSSKSNITLSASQTDSIPTIILSNDYDFTVDKEPIPQVSTGSAKLQGFPTFSSDEIPVAVEPQITTPKKDQELIDTKPSFQGKALPNGEVEVTIHSTEEIKQVITADQNGNWSYRPTQPLSPGQHTITIKARDKSGILKTITQSFTVFAAGNQVTQSATPSATPTTIPTPTLTATPSASPTPIVATPTPTITIVPTSSPSSAISSPPGNDSFLAITIFGLSIIGLGIFLLLLARGRLASL